MTIDLERRLRRDLAELDSIELPPFDQARSETALRRPRWLSVAATVLVVLGTIGVAFAIGRVNDTSEPLQSPPPPTEPVESTAPIDDAEGALTFDIEYLKDWPLRGVNQPTAVWTGELAIIFGGAQSDGNPSRRTIAFDPRTRETAPLTDVPGAVGTGGHIAAADATNVWVVGGGAVSDDSPRSSVAYRYDIARDEWMPIAPTPVPTNDRDPWVFTGEDLYVWLPKFGPHRYDAADDTWVELPAPSRAGAGPVPSPTGAASVWTGDEWIVWGGATSDGYAYDPALDSWRTLPDVDLPGRETTGVWNGKEMIIPPGRRGTTTPMAIGGSAAYDPSTDTWRKLNGGPQHPGLNAVAVDRFLVGFMKGGYSVLDPEVVIDPDVGPVGRWYDRRPGDPVPTSGFLWTGNELLALDAGWTDPAIMTPK